MLFPDPKKVLHGDEGIRKQKDWVLLFAREVLGALPRALPDFKIVTWHFLVGP